MEAFRYFLKHSALAFGLRLTLVIFSLLVVTLSFAMFIARQPEPSSPYINFLSNREGEREIYQMRPDGSHIKRLTFGFKIDFIPTWSPDGQWFTYAVSRRSPPHIYLEQLNSPEPLPLTGLVGYQVQPSWSPDGEWIVYSSNASGSYEIYRSRLDDSERYRMTNRFNSDWNPVWSWNGEWVAFESDNAGNRDIYLIPADNIVVDTGEEDLATGEQEGFELSNPDTTEEVVTESDIPPAVDPVQLTQTEGRDWQLVWSPDSQWIAFISERDGNPELYKMRLDASQVTRLTFTEAIEANPDWSPDGRWIAFESERDGNRELYKMRPDASEVIRLTFKEDIDYKAQWSPIVDLPWRTFIPLSLGLLMLGISLSPLRKGRVLTMQDYTP